MNSTIITEEGVEVTIGDPVSYTATIAPAVSVTATVIGIQGPRGTDGTNAEGGLFYTFNWGDATPKLLCNLEGNRPILEASIFIVEPMNGVGAALSIGDSGDYERLMTTSENIPTVVGGYSAYPSYEYDTDTNIYLKITPGTGCSQGYGVVTLTVKSEVT